MREILLIIHFIGLAMGIGTSFGFMFLGKAAAKLPKEEGLKFVLNSFALSKMGHTGLVLLVLSGLMLMMPYWGTLLTTPLLMLKLSFVLVLGALVGIISANAKKAQKGDPLKYLPKVRKLGPISLLVSITIVILAVLVFH